MPGSGSTSAPDEDHSADSTGFNKDTGFYWRGAVWPPTEYMVLQGLKAAGLEEEAHLLAGKHYAAFGEAFRAAGDIGENLAPYKPVMQGAGKFCGWGGLPPIAILIEDIFGLRVDAPSGKVTWILRRPERHGVENLRFGGRTVSLVAEPTSGEGAPRRIAVTATGEFDLTAIGPSGTVTRRIPKGETAVTVP